MDGASSSLSLKLILGVVFLRFLKHLYLSLRQSQKRVSMRVRLRERSLPGDSALFFIVICLKTKERERVSLLFFLLRPLLSEKKKKKTSLKLTQLL